METTPYLSTTWTLMQTAWRRYQEAWRSVAGLAALYALATIGTIVVVGAIAVGGLLAAPGSEAVIVLGGMLLLVLAAAVLLWLASVFNLGFIHLAIASERLTVWQAFDRGWLGAPSYLWLMLVQSVFIMGGYVLLVVPGVIFGLLSSVSVFVLAVEHKRGLAAITRSWSYVSARKWDVFVRLFAFGIVLALAVLLVRIVLLILAQFVGPVTAFVLSEVVTLGLDFFVLLPLVMFFLAALYTSLRESRPLTPENEAGEPDRRGTILGFAIFGALCVGVCLLLFAVGALLAAAAYATGHFLQVVPHSPFGPK